VKDRKASSQGTQDTECRAMLNGENHCGRLGDGTTVSKFTPVQIMTGVKDMFSGGYHTILLKQDGAVFTVGHVLSTSQRDRVRTARH